MTPWKLLLGLGAACAACCAIPLVAATGGIALFGSALLAHLEAFVPASLLLATGAGAVVVAGLWWMRKRRASSRPGCGSGGACAKEMTDAAR